MAADGNPEVNLETENHSKGGEEGEGIELQSWDEVQGVHERNMGYQERQIFRLVELYADEENDSAEIKRKKSMARAALTTWKETSDTIQSQMLQNKSQMRSIMNEVYTLVGLYSVFEGVVLTAVATSSTLECQHLWSPVGLSLFAYFMLVVVAFTKFRENRDLEKLKEISRRTLVEIVTWVYKLRRNGYVDFDFDRDCREKRYLKPKVPFWRNALGLIVPLTIFTTGLVFSFIHILCWS